ncbi:hypothetical protein [Barrientosiimonas humi]|uniref:hypothetical protein n=1 Tax=Barrientosiimonas humi TaxID=999931 RepID=UPI00370D3F17
MDLTPYVDLLRRDLSSAAEVEGDQGREAARTLLVALEPAARLALMEAVAQAAAEISSELPAGSVEVRLAGRDLDFVVDAPPTVPEPPAAPAPPGPPGEADDGTLARVTLRLPEQVKKRAEDLAGDAGQSLNTWLVNAVRAATASGGTDSFDPFRDSGRSRRGHSRMNGWL